MNDIDWEEMLIKGFLFSCAIMFVVSQFFSLDFMPTYDSLHMGFLLPVGITAVLVGIYFSVRKVRK